MKYFIRSVKYFFYYILILIVIMAVLVAAGLVEQDPATMFRNGFKSVGQILLLFAVVAAIYPKVGFCKRKAVVEGEFEDLKDGIKIIMEDRGYRLESENGEKMTFRLASKINAVARMLEDRVTVCAVPDGLEVEGITKDVIRIIDQPGFHHGKDPGIYSRIEFFAGAVEPDLLDDKIPLLPAARLEGRERPAGDKAALEGTDDPLRIADVDL